MLSVSERYLESVVADSRNMPYRVTITGVGLLDRSKVTNMTLEESVSGASGIELGTANSSTLRLTIKDAQPIDYIDLMVMPESGLVLPDGSIEWVPLGVFWVTDSSTSNDYKTLNLTCSDGMYNMSGEYVSRLTYPSTIKAVVAEIVAQAGVEFEGIDSLPDIPVRRRLEGATHRTAIGYAAGCCGKNARFNRRGKLEFTWYRDTGITIERRTQYLDGMTKLNNTPLTVGFEITGRKETYSVEVFSDENGGVVATPGQGVLENDRVVLSVSPFKGYELATITAVTEAGVAVQLYKNSEGGYDFVQPDSNVIVTAAFRQNANGPFELTARAYEGGSIAQDPSGHEAGNSYFDKGDVATVTIVPNDGKQIDRIVTTPGNLEYTQSGSSYSFAMPQSDVSVTVYFKDADVVVTPYSWLQKPVAPPSTKQYWAVFYKDDPNLPTCQKYYLVWFDSWTASVYDTAYDMTEYKVTLNGYYYCGSKNNGNGAHEWDGAWTGNGDIASSVQWNSYLGFMWSGTDSERVEKQYCLIASNTDLTRNGSVIFEHNESNITGVQTPYIQNGMDVRERGSLGYWMCPDTFSTPLPSPNWMILMPEDGLYMTIGEDGKYDTPLSSYPSSMIVLFYDSISIRSIGVVDDQSSEEFYIASVTNGRWAYLRSENIGWDQLHELPEGAVIGFRNPLISTESEYVYNDGNSYQFAGLLATNTTLYVGGSVFMYKNDCRVCDCVSSEKVAMLSRRSATDNLIHDDSIEHIKISYTNPMIYEKMVPYIESVVQGITYTPAKIKHRGNPAFQAGDVVTAPDKDGVFHTILIIQQRMVFGGGMNSEITCPGQTQKTKNFLANSLSNSPVKQEIEKSNAELEHRIAVNNALVYTAIYKSISVSEASIKSIAEWQTENSNALAKFEQTVSDTYATQEMLSKVETDVSNTLSKYTQKVNANEVSIKSLTKWQGATGDRLTTIEQKSDIQSAGISLIAGYSGLSKAVVVDSTADMASWDRRKLYLSKSNGKYYAWREASGDLSVTASGSTLTFTGSVSATTKGRRLCLTTADGILPCSYGTTLAVLSKSMWIEIDAPVSDSVAQIEQKVNKDGAAIELLVEYDSAGKPKASGSLIIGAINGESSAKISADRLDIEGKTLNIKVDATNIEGKLTAEQIDVKGVLSSYDVDVSGSFSTSSANGTQSVLIKGGIISVDSPEVISGEGLLISKDLLQFKVLDKTYALRITCVLPDSETGSAVFSEFSIVKL